MTRLLFYGRVALTNLRHGGQRMLVAILCVAFGVMSILAMTLLSSALEQMLVEAPHDLIGADISMDRLAENTISPADITRLDALRQSGVIDQYTLVAYTSSLSFRLPNSGELHFPGAGIGIDPSAYPPIGALTVNSPGQVGLPTLLQETGDILVSRDLALEYNLKAGDTLIISDLTIGAPLEGHIRGIIVDTPNHQGSKLYYNLATAARLANDSPSLNTVLVTTTNPTPAKTQLEASGWRVFLASQMAADGAQVQAMLAMLLNGVGVLGLLVGGVGIANTMTVLLRRRRREIAIWKSMGYQSGDLLVLFSIEAGVLGLAGSLLGVAAGLAVSARLVDLFSRTTTLLIHWVLTPEPVILALFVGVVTTIVFALWAIVTSSRVSPVTLLRDEPANAAQMPRLQAAGLALMLALPFTAVISLVMGSLIKAVGVLIVAAVGLVGLGGGLGGLLWLFTRLLPLRSAPLLNMARGNLRRRGLAPVFALIALFVGVVALTLAGIVTQNATRVMDAKNAEQPGDNLTILAPAEQETAVAQAVAAQTVESLTTGYQTRVQSIHLVDSPQVTLAPLLVARSSADSYQLTGAPWGSRPNGVYLPNMGMISEGSQITITTADGSLRTLPVVGTYRVNFQRMLRPELGVLLPVGLSRSIAPPEQVQYQVRIPAGQLSAAARSLGSALPQATVINLVAYDARFTSQYHNLFIFAVSMASLALLAGVLLMANSVSLAMLDRRYEIGVLKAMGYARRHILVTLVVEYAMIALVACGAGLLLIRGFLFLMGLQSPLAASLLVLTPLAASLVGVVTLSLTVLTVLTVTWKPTQVSPLVVLNDRV